jgi:hypothetical protein
MTLIRTLICLAVIAVITLVANYVMSKYHADLVRSAAEYADLMANIPEEFGDWKRAKEADLPGYALEQLQVSDAKNWTYVNTQTDEKVNVSFLVGPTGRLAVHTPEICMDGQGFMVGQERQREHFSRSVSPPQSADDGNGENGTSDDQNTFWRVAIVSRSAADYQIVSYYALGTGKQWWAKDNPRYELAQYPFILKMQVETLSQSDPESYNAARNFLKDFLPEVANVYADTDLQGKYDR